MVIKYSYTQLPTPREPARTVEEISGSARGNRRCGENSSKLSPQSEAETEEIVITRNGKPAGLLIGFASEEDWLDYRLENDPRFLRRIEEARNSLRQGRGGRIEDVE